MKKLFFLTLFATVVWALAICAKADTFTLNSATYTDPATGFGVGPLSATLNHEFNFTAFCIDFADHVSYGDTWNVTVVNLADYSGNRNPFEQEAYLTIQMSHTTNAQTIADMQYAIWRIAGATDSSLVNTQSTFWVNQAQSQTFAPGFASDINVYFRSGDHGQNMISVIPEPSTTIAIAFFALVGFTFWGRRQFFGTVKHRGDRWNQSTTVGAK